MSGAKRHSPPPQPFGVMPAAQAKSVLQPMKSFQALRPGQAERASAGPAAGGDELVPGAMGLFHVRQAERGTMERPNGTYNFVRVQGETRNAGRTLVSTRSGHAGLAAGQPVIYAGTVRFENGSIDWWSNYSGTYQPMAAFRQQARLPEDRFVPWQRLQMGGVSMQRGTFQDRRASTAPAAVSRPEQVAPDTDRPTAPGRPEPGRAAAPSTATAAPSRQPATPATTPAATLPTTPSVAPPAARPVAASRTVSTGAAAVKPPSAATVSPVPARQSASAAAVQGKRFR
jgi:hypothetical protein